LEATKQNSANKEIRSGSLLGGLRCEHAIALNGITYIGKKQAFAVRQRYRAVSSCDRFVAVEPQRMGLATRDAATGGAGLQLF
jgi:hypothetical protein